MFPDYLDGAKVLEYTDPGDFGIIEDYDDDGLPLAREVRYLAVCAYTGDMARYLFSCDSDYAVIGDACCDTTAECKDIHPHAVWHPKNDPYFRNAAQRKSQGSTCYLEFQRGRFRGKHWLERSLYLHDDVFEQLGLYEIFVAALPEFDHYGVTEVTPAQYEELKALALERGGEIAAAIRELEHWAENCFLTETRFTICGI